MRTIGTVLLAAMIVMGTGCSITKKATSFNGLSDFDGRKVTHYNTSNYAVNILIEQPIAGDASLDATVEELTKHAKADGAEQVQIVQSRYNVWWWIFPPFSFVICPVISSVAADAH